MILVNALDLRKKAAIVLDAVAEKHEPVTITRENKPLAIDITADDYREKVLNGERGRKHRDLSARIDAGKKEHRNETARRDAGKAIRESRERR